MKAKVTAETTVNNVPAKVGDVVEVDAKTFENLSRKGRLAEITAEKPAEKPAKKKAE